MMGAITALSLRLSRPQGIQRLGQALWMMAGEPVEPSALVWARALLGGTGDTLLWSALFEEGVVLEPERLLNPARLASFLSRLWVNEPAAALTGRLVWTLPAQLVVPGIPGDSYVRATRELAQGAQRTLTIVSPYVEPRGEGLLHEAMLGALHKGVALTILTHEAEVLSSLASASLKDLQRESVGMSGMLSVFTASGESAVLLHMKATVADAARALLGSANVTHKGFGGNLEGGVMLGASEAAEIEQVVLSVIRGGLATRSFCSK